MGGVGFFFTFIFLAMGCFPLTFFADFLMPRSCFCHAPLAFIFALLAAFFASALRLPFSLACSEVYNRRCLFSWFCASITSVLDMCDITISCCSFRSAWRCGLMVAEPAAEPTAWPSATKAAFLAAVEACLNRTDEHASLISPSSLLLPQPPRQGSQSSFS